MSRAHLQTILRHAEALAADHAADAELLARFVATRDDRAFATLVRRHGAMVWNVCRNLLPADADAEDAFQATFLALVRGGRRVRHGERLAAWLHGVAVRVAMKVRRTAANRRHREQAAATTEAAVPVSESSWNELLAAVHEEVERLPDGLRSAFVLCCLEGVRQADAADQLGLKVNTLTARLARARQRVIDRLARRGLTAGTAAGAVALGSATGTAAAPPALAELAAALPRSLESLSPTVLQLAQGAFEMSTRTKWLAAALLVATAMTTTIGTAVFSDATGQTPGSDRGGRDARAAGGRSGGPSVAFLSVRTPQWEYKVTTVPLVGLTPEQELNKLGEEGWELVTSGEKGALVFKRQKVRVLTAPAGRGGDGDEAAPAVEKKADGVTTQVFPIKHTQASTLSATLAPLLAADDGRGFGGNPFGGNVRLSGRTKLTVDDRTNSLIVIADDATLKMIKELVEKLDVPVKDEPKRPSK
jgi:RNA polymerase sigma factor (sigma-70 family)